MGNPGNTWLQRGRLRIKHLVLLAELGETGNIRRAASQLNMTQPAASKLLMEAEEVFGRRLFERSRRGIVPNDAGRVAIHKAKFLLQELDGARDEIALAAEDPAGRVMVGAYAVAVSLLLPMTVLRLKAAYPRILLTVDEGTNSGLLPALERGALDCVVGRLPEDLPPGLEAQILYDEPVVVVCGPHHPLLGAPAPTLADLAAEDWILPPLDHPFRKRLEALFSVAGLKPPNVILESASSMMNASTVPNSRALAMMPIGTARFLESLQSVGILPFSLGSAHPPVAVLLRKGAEPGVALAKFLEALHLTAGQLKAPYLSEVSAL